MPLPKTVSRLRKNPEQCALVTGLGWFLTKHAAGIYSGVALEKPWHRPFRETLQHSIDAMESPRLTEKPSGRATVETYTVLRHYFQEKGKRFPPLLHGWMTAPGVLPPRRMTRICILPWKPRSLSEKTGMVFTRQRRPQLDPILRVVIAGNVLVIRASWLHLASQITSCSY